MSPQYNFKKSMKACGVTKQLSCNIKFSYDGTVVDKAKSTAKCTVKNWPKKKKCTAKLTSGKYKLGTPSTGLFEATMTVTVTKAKNKPSNKATTAKTSVWSSGDISDVQRPIELWCPAEDKWVWGEGPYGSVIGDFPAANYTMCAKSCVDYKTEAGNYNCFFWQFNSNSEDTYDLPAKTCRLFPYIPKENVKGAAVGGIESGYWKCYPALVTRGLAS